MTREYAFRDIGGLTKTLRLLLAINAAMSVVSLVSAGLYAVHLRSQTVLSETELSADEIREVVIDGLDLVLVVVTAITFLSWIVRANRNARALGAVDLRISPGWAVGFFFVPILNLWKPYQAMRDLWQASRDPGAWRAVPTEDSPVRIWWALWLVANATGRAAAGAARRAADVPGMQAAVIADMVSDVAFAALCLVARALVTEIAESQRQAAARAHAVAAAPDAAPPVASN